MKKNLKITIFILIGLSVLMVTLYFSKFSSGLSEDPTVWGAFGSYISPILSMLTMIVLLMTFNNQKNVDNYNRKKEYYLKLFEYIDEEYNMFNISDRYFSKVNKNGYWETGPEDIEDIKVLPHKDEEKIKRIYYLDENIGFINDLYISDKKIKGKIKIFRNICFDSITLFYRANIIDKDAPKLEYYGYHYVYFLYEDIIKFIKKELAFEEYIDENQIDEFDENIIRELKKRIDKFKKDNNMD